MTLHQTFTKNSLTFGFKERKVILRHQKWAKLVIGITHIMKTDGTHTNNKSKSSNFKPETSLKIHKLQKES